MPINFNIHLYFLDQSNALRRSGLVQWLALLPPGFEFWWSGTFFCVDFSCSTGVFEDSHWLLPTVQRHACGGKPIDDSILALGVKGHFQLSDELVTCLHSTLPY